MKYFIRIVFIYFSLLVIFTSLIIVSHLIPSSAIANNAVQSAKILQEEGLYPKFVNFKLYQMDNFTDAMMINLSASVDHSKPVESAMMNYYYTSDDFMDLAYATEKVAIEKT
jgi:hypothetical protein